MFNRTRAMAKKKTKTSLLLSLLIMLLCLSFHVRVTESRLHHVGQYLLSPKLCYTIIVIFEIYILINCDFSLAKISKFSFY